MRIFAGGPLLSIDSVPGNSDQIVITGVGLVTPLGLTAEQTWRAVLQNRCGIGPMPAMESPLPPGADGGQAPDLPAGFAPELPRESRYLRYAIGQAIDDARLSAPPYAPQHCGIVLGTTLHGMRAAGRFLRSGDRSQLRDFLAGAVARAAATDLNFTGITATTCSACSSSLGSIALGVTLLRSRQLDLVIAGGYDTISEYVYAGFNSLRLVAPGPLRPFTRGRQGMKLAEGYGIVVLERAADARRRGAQMLAEILGYGESADAHHLTQPHPQGEGAARAIEAALRDAGLGPRDIGLIAAHATGTPDNDAAEYAALSRVFGSELPRVDVVAFKSHLGHTLGGAGAVELILSTMALRDQVAPACANVCAGELEFPDLKLSTESRRAAIGVTLNTSLGFGGANTCMILGSVGSAPRTRVSPLCGPYKSSRDVFVTGIGVVFPGAIGNDAFAARFRDPSALALERDTGAIEDAEIDSLLSARRVRRMSNYVKLSLAASMLCLRDAGIGDTASFGQTCAAILGSTHGSTIYSEAYYRQIVREGIVAANPMLFAEGVPNAAAAHLSLMLSLKGPCQAVIGSRTAGLDAVRLAAARIAQGQWDRAIVGAAEEYSPDVNETYRHFGLYAGVAGPGDGQQRGFIAGCGAASFLLESRESLESRGGRARGKILGAAGGMTTPSQSPRLLRRILRQLDSPPALISSANKTWIDRVEAAGIGRTNGQLSAPYGYVAECFSVLPLAGIAAVLVTGRLPRLLIAAPRGPHPADGTAAPDRFAALATDYAGAVSAVAIQPI